MDLPGVKSTIILKNNRSWDGTLLPSYPKEQPEITIQKVEIEANTLLPLHVHPIINTGYILEGSIDVFSEDGQLTLHLDAGQATNEMVRRAHYGKAGPSGVKILVFYAGYKSCELASTPNASNT